MKKEKEGGAEEGGKKRRGEKGREGRKSPLSRLLYYNPVSSLITWEK